MSDTKIKRPRGRPFTFEREEVLWRAMQVFRALGFDAAAIPTLTEAMGISAQSLYAAFGSKEELYRETIGLYLRTRGAFVVNALAEESDAILALTKLLRDAAAVYSDQPGMGCMITVASGETTDESLRSFKQALRADGFHAIKTRLERGVSEGQLTTKTDCAVWARFITCTLYGMSTQARDGASIEDLLALANVSAQNLISIRARKMSG
jgi:AcrR family transcriptional regulator